jgi:transposase
MEVLYPRCAGLDVHKDTVVACVRCVSEPQHRETRSFATTTSGLLSLGDWISDHGCTHVAMEATGIYWRPVWHVLEGQASIRSSFVPPRPIQELRDLTRTRKQLVREISQHSLRIQKVLEDANIKLGSVLSDVLGVSGRAMLGAIIEGESDPETLAGLARGTARHKHDALVEALHGRIRSHHRILLKLHLGLIVALEHTVGEVDAAVGKSLEPIAQCARLLTTMPGINDIVAQVIVAEIGTDMTRFETSGHLVSWACLCPRNDESAGKRRSTRLRKGGTWLKTALVTAAWAAVRSKVSYLRALFLRIKARRGAKKAIIAVAASMLTSAYFMLRDAVPYRDLGPSHFDKQHRQKTIQRLVRRLQDLGHTFPAQPQTA